MNKCQKFYDAKAASYANEWYDNDLLLPTIKDFLLAFKETKPNILDLGCGPGNETSRISKEGAKVVGIDFSKESIRIAKERNPDITFYEMNFFDITKDIGQFNGIFACSSLIHLKGEEIEELLEIIKPVLKKPAYFLNIFMVGIGQRITHPEINGEKIERIIEMIDEERTKMIFEKHGFTFSKKGYLDNSLSSNWTNQIYYYG